MRGSPRLLYWAAFFLALGGVMAATELRLVDPGPVLAALRFWPIAVIALGVALVARRTRYSLPAWLVAAALPGLLLGGAIDVGPRVTLDCASGDRPVLATQEGVLQEPASVDVSAGCGNLAVATQAGAAWRLETGDPGRATASVSSSAAGLRIDAGTTGTFGDAGSAAPTTWRLTLPTTPIDQLALALSAGDGTVDLAGAQVTALAIKGSAAELHVDLSRASVARLSASVSVAGLWISLPDADLSASLDASIGQIWMCLPADVGLRVNREGALGVVRYEGFEQDAAEWQSPGYEQARFHVDLTLTPNVAGIELNSAEGCG